MADTDANDEQRNFGSELNLRQKAVRWAKRVIKGCAILAMIYIAAILIGLIPVNNDFTPTDGGIEIFVTSNPVHSDILLPIQSEEKNWSTSLPESDFQQRSPDATHVGFGWGDRGFYINTPTWAEFKVTTAANALLIPSSTVMHVGFIGEPNVDANTRSVMISRDQYRALVKYVENSFKLDANGSVQEIQDTAYGMNDAFYQATGSYHCLNTCNCWIGGAMKSAGIRAGWFTPLPKTVFFYLP